MNKVYVTEEQYKILNDAWELTRGTPDYYKYDCETSFKCHGKTNWRFTGYTCPAFIKGYFKTVRGETYIYSDVDSYGNFDRVRLNDECKALLGIN